MIYHATNLIAQTFEEMEVEFQLEEIGPFSSIISTFETLTGHSVKVHYISCDDNNGVSVRVFGLFSPIPVSQRLAILNICNSIHNNYPFFKFYLDSHSNLNINADLPFSIDDASVGPCCFEYFMLLKACVNKYCSDFVSVLNSSTIREKKNANDLMAVLNELRKHPIIINSQDNELEVQ